MSFGPRTSARCPKTWYLQVPPNSWLLEAFDRTCELKSTSWGCRPRTNQAVDLPATISLDMAVQKRPWPPSMALRLGCAWCLPADPKNTLSNSWDLTLLQVLRPANGITVFKGRPASGRSVGCFWGITNRPSFQSQDAAMDEPFNLLYREVMAAYPAAPHRSFSDESLGRW